MAVHPPPLSVWVMDLDLHGILSDGFEADTARQREALPG